MIVIAFDDGQSKLYCFSRRDLRQMTCGMLGHYGCALSEASKHVLSQRDVSLLTGTGGRCRSPGRSGASSFWSIEGAIDGNVSWPSA